MTPAPRVVAGVAAGVAALLALAGCSSSGNTKADDPVISPIPTTSAAPASTSVPPSSAAPTSTTPAPSASASDHPTGSSSAAPRSTCTSVSLRVIRGSASAGQEIAALQFSNDGTSTCELLGYPSVTLLLHGKPIGTPARPSTAGASARTLTSGDVAESLLHDYSNCQAPLSDSVRVVVPGSSVTVVRPAQLRACTIRVDALGAPD